MKLEKAIEILRTFRDEGDEDLPLDVEPAINLGIEALKRDVHNRLIGNHPDQAKLPGETPPGDSP